MSDRPLNDTSETPAADAAETDAEHGLNAHPADGLAPLDAVIAERDEWKDRALRVAAEMENLKRRAETQQNDARAFAIQRFAKDLLGVADNLERALMAAPKDAEGATAGLVTGLEMTQKALLQAFDSNGLKLVKPAAASRTPSSRFWSSPCEDASIARWVTPALAMAEMWRCSVIGSGVVCAKGAS